MPPLETEKASESTDLKSKLKLYQNWIFLVTFANYALAHWTRKYVSMQDEL